MLHSTLTQKAKYPILNDNSATNTFNEVENFIVGDRLWSLILEEAQHGSQERGQPWE